MTEDPLKEAPTAKAYFNPPLEITPEETPHEWLSKIKGETNDESTLPEKPAVPGTNAAPISQHFSTGKITGGPPADGQRPVKKGPHSSIG